jgi:hypothetical protein
MLGGPNQVRIGILMISSNEAISGGNFLENRPPGECVVHHRSWTSRIGNLLDLRPGLAARLGRAFTPNAGGPMGRLAR